MAEYDVFDEAIINAKPSVVYKALLTEYSGETNWWRPCFKAKPRKAGAVDKPGALIDITLHGGRTLKKITAKTEQVKKNEILRFQYVEGDFRGEGTWKLEGIDGETKLSFRWRCRLSKLILRIMAPFVNIPKRHSEVMKLGFEGLNKHIKKSVGS